MKKIIFFFLTLSTLIFSELTIIPDATQIYIGEEVGIKILSDERVYVEFNLGGFEDPEIIFDGTEKEYVKYIAPLIESSDTLVFKTSKEEKKITLYFVKKEEKTLPKAFAKVNDFFGNVAIKKQDVWEPITTNTIIEEGDEILTMSNSFLEILFPDGSISKIMENSQVFVEKLRYKEKIDVVLNLKKGENYNIIQKFLVSGSSFKVKTSSVTAGVRGTRFSVINKDGSTNIITFDGVVFAYFNNGKIIPVKQGFSLSSFEKPTKNTIPENKFEKPKIKKEEKTKTEEKETKETKSQEIPPISIEPVNKNGIDYMIYSISPEFNLGIITLGIGFTAYSTEVGGTLYYGLPSSSPSTNIINAFTINSVSLSLFGATLRYGNMFPVSLAMGFTTRDYYNYPAKAFDIAYENELIYLFLHLPYELSKIFPFEFNSSDSVFLGEFALKYNLPLIGTSKIGVSITYDFEASNTYVINEATPINSAFSLFVKKQLIDNVDLGIELSIENGEKIAYGLFSGIYGKLGFVNITGGIYYHLDGFIPYYFSRNYLYLKNNKSLPSMSNDSTFGYLLGFDFETQYAAGRFYLYGFDPKLEGEGRVIIPSFGAFSGLFVTAYYYDPTPFVNGFLSLDTTTYIKITYPLVGESLTGGIILSWNGYEWVENVIFGAEIWR
ncbi:hypothetical protein SU69_01740 [Thermosipho melanesiensis]|uniref:FecR protein domain-containing protein n=2 Tax=Thermosipho melanesiensis TaxID=46541 RepID=A6LJV3_THEM4|nr:FecR family protein [Thermosipho melanesiensis]ABR30204.1 hypothetical protein Tmel_0334 [Thermosipho melanesiensis BI429]APT73402.1 hypothetical protein BW47_01795 [Thermosipho melanesiensis]OOC38216.1 hypothetical protein SU68_01750 [Thermosipho melanesiensis]OOC40045.1 hypothetical protein SU69_01740 [Thermosipho melanesiensis]OOC40065.1 hypothetical protein SU70_01735 [Thermosipho melanesiensis]